MTANLARLAAIGGFRRLAPTVGRYLSDERLQRVYSFQAMYAGLSPYDALAIYAVISYMDAVAGVFFPAGGLHAVPVAMAAAAEKHGVEIRYSTPVERVEHSGGRATAVVTAAASGCRATPSSSTPTCRSRTASCWGHAAAGAAAAVLAVVLAAAGGLAVAGNAAARTTRSTSATRGATRGGAFRPKYFDILEQRPVRPTRCCAGTRHWPVVFNRICQRDGPTGRQIRLYIIACNPQ